MISMRMFLETRGGTSRRERTNAQGGGTGKRSNKVRKICMCVHVCMCAYLYIYMCVSVCSRMCIDEDYACDYVYVVCVSMCVYVGVRNPLTNG